MALYVRVSTDEQAENGHGLEIQRDRLKKYCESQCNEYQTYELDDARIYEDAGYSGSLPVKDRPALKRLVEDAKAKKFDMVIVYRVDRFARSSEVLITTVNTLIAYEVDFKSATEPFDTDTPMGKFMMKILGDIAELERETIKERLSGGRERSAKNGKWVTGVPPYGYRVVKATKLLEIMPEEAEVVKKFYEWLAYERYSLTEICKRANELGLPSPKHKTIKKGGSRNYWWKRTINRILVNEVYTGEFYYRKYKRPFKYLDGVLNEEHQRPQKDWITISVPTIVSRELFEAAIKQLGRNRENSLRNTKRPYLYSKLLYCGQSGLKLQSGYQAPRVHKSSPTLGKYYHTYVAERR